MLDPNSGGIPVGSQRLSLPPAESGMKGLQNSWGRTEENSEEKLGMGQWRREWGDGDGMGMVELEWEWWRWNGNGGAGIGMAALGSEWWPCHRVGRAGMRMKELG